MAILQFIPASPAPVMGRLIRSLKHADTMAVLDIEDGYLDVYDPARTAARKVEARKLLLETCALCRGRTAGRPVAVRVNIVGTEDFERDLPLTRAAAESFGVAMVLLPKITAPEELQMAKGALAEAGIQCGGLVPMIETERGMQAVAEVVAAAKELGAPAVLYGYHDYCLDAGHWPFLDLGEKQFWAAVARVAEPTLAAGLRYVHPPQVDLHDEARLSELIARLRGLCGDNFDILSAGMSQTVVLRQLTSQPSAEVATLAPLEDRPALDAAEGRKLAKEICALFEGNHRVEHSFSADARTGRFIPPHEYLAAVRFLQGAGGA